jgi:hypothetical protein
LKVELVTSPSKRRRHSLSQWCNPRPHLCGPDVDFKQSFPGSASLIAGRTMGKSSARREL